MKFLDKYGWPVERIKGRPMTKVIRLLLWARKVRCGKWRRTDRFTAHVRIQNLTRAQLIALEDMFATWVFLGGIGSSRWTRFYADGDGNFRPRITVNGRKAEQTSVIGADRKWPNGSDGDYEIDFDWVAWNLHDGVGVTCANP